MIATLTWVMISTSISSNIAFTSSLKSKLEVSSVTGAIVDSLVVLVSKELESEVMFLFCVGGGVESSLRLLEKEMVYGRWMLKGEDAIIG